MKMPQQASEPPVASTEEKIAYGGQAVLEGVMMRSRACVATAVRHPAGQIIVRSERIAPGKLARAFRRIPVLRGTAALWDILVLGMRSLAFSAAVAADADSPDSRPELEAAPPGNAARIDANAGFVWTSLALGIGLGVALFLVLPVLLTRLIDPAIESDFLSNLIEGSIRLAILVAYLWGIGFVPDIRRTLAYHGAEHKTVNAVEAGESLTVETVMPYSSAHPRCGTNFLLIVVLLSIFVFALLGRPDLPLRVASRLALVPLIAGLGYELIRLLAAHRRNALAAALLRPGLLLQALTTREPAADQVEVAIAAMAQVLEAEGERRLLPPAGQLPAVTFSSP